MNIQYSWRSLQRTFTFTVPWFGRWASFEVCRELKVACGFWCSVTVDEVVETIQPRKSENDARLKIYQPLNHHEIRVLRLMPGTGDEALRGVIQTTVLFDRAVSLTTSGYVALSYVWGYEEDKGTITIDGTELIITQNLDRCLRHLRHKEDIVTLWIDSICINQDDVSEKSQQVALMPHIYSEAREVAAWLGEASQYSPVGMNVIEYFAIHPRPRKDAIWMTLPQELILAGLTDIMARAWFQRIWVVQEVVMARRIRMVCGKQSVTWTRNTGVPETFARMIKFACIQPEWRNRRFDSVRIEPLLKLLDLQIEVMSMNGFGTNRLSADVLDIAYELRHKLASDPRDMLFSIFGMVDGSWNSSDFKPDYRLSVGQSYDHLQNTVRFCSFDCFTPEQHVKLCHNHDGLRHFDAAREAVPFPRSSFRSRPPFPLAEETHALCSEMIVGSEV